MEKYRRDPNGPRALEYVHQVDAGLVWLEDLDAKFSAEDFAIEDGLPIFLDAHENETGIRLTRPEVKIRTKSVTKADVRVMNEAEGYERYIPADSIFVWFTGPNLRGAR